MAPTPQELAARYRDMGTNELVLLKFGGGLVKEAVEVLQAELERRGVTEADCQRIQHEMDANPAKAVPLKQDIGKGLRWLGGIALVVLLMGAASVLAKGFHQQYPALGLGIVITIGIFWLMRRWRARRP